ncbi:MAG: hypothetical protein GXY94_12385, partial [Bacteroidales bacterium]|nr:hypothetical protein [Bacteroidales bacterium]
MNIKNKIKQYHLIRELKKLVSSDDRSLEIIIFSKDRPIQLYALIESYFYYSKVSNPITVIYKCSNEGFTKAYHEIGKKFSNLKFVKDTNFRDVLIKTVEQINASRLLFLVDDIIFTREFNTSSFDQYDLKHTVPSLRLGKNIVYSYTRQKTILQPEFRTNGMHIEWNWIKRNSYWSYPLSVDGHIFDRTEILFMLKHISYKAPNSLEEALQFFSKAFFIRKGLSYENSVLVNIPWNLVQTEIVNLHENISTDELLKYWNTSKKIDTLFFQNIA